MIMRAIVACITVSAAGSASADDPYRRALTLALHRFADHGDTEEAVALLDRHPWLANSELPALGKPTHNHDGFRPLHRAAACGDTALVKALLKRGAEVNAEDRFGITALHLSAQVGDADALSTLLVAGAKVDARTGWRRETALHLAAKGGHLEAVKLLVRRGADLNAKTDRVAIPVVPPSSPALSAPNAATTRAPEVLPSRTAVELAREGGHSAVAEFLRSAGD